MVLFTPGKWPGLILASYLAVAIAGSFAFAEQSSSGCFNSINHTIDWLAEDTAAISKAQGYSFSPLRYDGLRIFLPMRPHNTGNSKDLEQSSLNPLNKTPHFTINNPALKDGVCCFGKVYVSGAIPFRTP